MLNVKLEQRVNVKFIMKLLKTGYGNLRFVKDCFWGKVIEDDPRPGRPRASKTGGNVDKFRDIILKNRYLSTRAFVELVNIDKETVGQILQENMQMKRVCDKMMQK
ncbi:protein GVQW3-like [Belonocnema kinseyi]|uniref:protein GVQW3-like n=1 Tax=Belonocnema kinseyi TaxID=2817044 RepID=UPI00143D8F55|nr:protein GVQW3-like [Belonocnema kinseyi]